MKKIIETIIFEWNNYKLTVGQLLLAATILVSASILIWYFKQIIKHRFSTNNKDTGRELALFQLASYFIWILATLMAMQALNINLTLLLAGSAALLVGIGLGLQQVFKDFISGFILLIDSTIEVGDVIEVDGMVARVEKINLRTSKLISRDDISVIVPNSKITENNVINWSHVEKLSRFYIDIGVAYSSDVELVKTILLDCAAAHQLVESSPQPFVRLESFGDSSINFKLFFWTKEVFRVENIKSELRFSVIHAFRSNNVVIPFPQMDVHFYKETI